MGGGPAANSATGEWVIKDKPLRCLTDAEEQRILKGLDPSAVNNARHQKARTCSVRWSPLVSPNGSVRLRPGTYRLRTLEAGGERNISFMLTTIGDAEAYHVVREHFALLGEVARKFDGTVVKTIGVGVHMSFNATETAFRAALAMQGRIAHFNKRAGREHMLIRVGLHIGSSISVTLNDRLDCYGSTANLAARLEGQGEGGDITMSAAFVNDAAVSPSLRGLCNDRACWFGFGALRSIQTGKIGRVSPS